MTKTLRKGGFNLRHDSCSSDENTRRCHPCVPILGILILIAITLVAGWAILKFGVHELYEKCKKGDNCPVIKTTVKPKAAQIAKNEDVGDQFGGFNNLTTPESKNGRFRRRK